MTNLDPFGNGWVLMQHSRKHTQSIQEKLKTHQYLTALSAFEKMGYGRSYGLTFSLLEHERV